MLSLTSGYMIVTEIYYHFMSNDLGALIGGLGIALPGLALLYIAFGKLRKMLK